MISSVIFIISSAFVFALIDKKIKFNNQLFTVIETENSQGIRKKILIGANQEENCLFCTSYYWNGDSYLERRIILRGRDLNKFLRECNKGGFESTAKRFCLEKFLY